MSMSDGEHLSKRPYEPAVSVLKWLDITKPPGTLPALLKKAPTTCLHHGSLGAVLFLVGAAESPVTQELINHKCAVVLGHRVNKFLKNSLLSVSLFIYRL